MTDHREVMRMALEAIEGSGHKDDLMAAAEALRAALDEPDDTITVRLTREDLDDLRYAALKALSLPTERVHDLRERVLGTFPEGK